ncbi:MAG: BRCT domain-containing protein [Gammaproteobacteria bacterium]|nr:BRCT domain-containing protein [Gammaproteobacteria bacterium]
MNISDVMIHIKESLDDSARAELEKEMQKLDGVVSPRFNPGKDHLMVIAYDTEKASSAALLAKVRSAGYTAQLVGM